MVKRLFLFFSSPVFESDPEKTRNARMVNLAFNALSLTIMAIILKGYFDPVTFTRYWIMLIILVISQGLRWLLIAGHVEWCGFLLAWIISLSTTAVLYTAGTVLAQASMYYIFAIVTAGLLVNFRAAIIIAGWNSLSVLLLILAQQGELLPATTPVQGIPVWVNFTFTFILMAVILYMITHTIEQAQEKARKELENRRQVTTSLRQSEAKFLNIFERSSDAIVLTDEQGSIIEWNTAAEKITGFKHSEVVGKLLWDIQYRLLPATQKIELSYNRFYSQMKKALQTGEAPWMNKALEGELETRDGQHRYFQQVVFLLPTENGFRLASTIRDISARKEAEKTSRKLNEELEERVHLRTRELESTIAELESFGYTISHNLRTPLRALDGHAAILQQEYQSQLPEAARSHLNRIQVNAQQLGRMVDELLIFHRLSRSSLEKVTIQPAEVIRDVLHEIRPRSTDRKIEVVVQEMPPCQADRSMLRQVFRNLILNALKFTQSREIANVIIGYERKNTKPVYYVRDDGVGFDQRYADKLFGTFQQLHAPREFEGMGMGLAIVQRIIHRHGGEIWAESAVNKGATFYFTLE